MNNEIKTIKVKIEELEKRVETLEESSLKKNNKREKGQEIEIHSSLKKIGLNENELYSIFDIDLENEIVHILKSIQGKNEKEKQFKAIVCLLTAYSFIFNKITIKSSLLSQEMKDLGIKSLVNLSTNMKAYGEYILPIGKPKSPNYSYKITVPGKEKGVEIIKEIIGKNGS